MQHTYKCICVLDSSMHTCFTSIHLHAPLLAVSPANLKPLQHCRLLEPSSFLSFFCLCHFFICLSLHFIAYVSLCKYLIFPLKSICFHDSVIHYLHNSHSRAKIIANTQTLAHTHTFSTKHTVSLWIAQGSLCCCRLSSVMRRVVCSKLRFGLNKVENSTLLTFGAP